MTFKKAEAVYNQILSKLIQTESRFPARIAIEKLRQVICSNDSMM